MLKCKTFNDALKVSYSKETLFKIFKIYFLKWIADGYIDSSLGLFEISLVTVNTNQQTFLELMEQMYSQKNFLTIYNSFSDNVKLVFNDIAWKGKHYIKDNKEEYLKISNSFNLTRDLKDEYLFFKGERDLKKDEYLTLDYPIIQRLRVLLPEKPKEYYIYPILDDTKTKFNSCEETEFMENIKLYYDFFSQHGLELSNSGKLLKESKLAMKKYCNIKEYYDDNFKDLQHLKTETIGLFFHLISKENLNFENFQTANLKDIILSFLNGSLLKNSKYHYAFLYLNYLKGLKVLKNHSEHLSRSLNSIYKVIKEFPITNENNPTISINNIIKRLILQNEFMEIIEFDIAFGQLYINEANYERTKINSHEQYINFIVIPFVKSVFFILGTLGVVELMYNPASNSNSLYLRNGHLSKYDGLKFVRLTNFGKYVFDFETSYNFDSFKNDGKIFLDNDRLFITIVGESPSNALFFESISQKISPNSFKVTFDTLLKNIKTKEELIDLINTIKCKVYGTIPQNWLDFFHEAISKSNLIELKKDFYVFKLQNSQELLMLISKEPRFSSLILKCENFHILVQEDNLSQLISLFREFGYSFNSVIENSKEL